MRYVANVNQLRVGKNLSSCVVSGWGRCGVSCNRLGSTVSSRSLVWSVSACWWVGVDGGTLIGDVSDKSSFVVSVVGDSLDPAVWEGNLK